MAVDQAVVDRVARKALDRALDRPEQLLLVYQPIHEARTGAIVAAEALLRQRRESGEIREASVIQEAAEASVGNELFTLDHLLIKQAWIDAALWQRSHPEVRLNVNLSPREFQEGNVLVRLDSLVSSCGIDRQRVNLEITETSYIEKPEDTMHVLQMLEDGGLHLWLDDFGTGHSSLTHLQRFPVEGIKISGKFVKSDDDRSRAITRALIALAHDLKMNVTAEEVETTTQLEFLRDCECDFVQGFLFSRPMPADELHATLARFSSGA